jgi:hypothetical protein
MRHFTRITVALPHDGGAHSAPARERRGTGAPASDRAGVRSGAQPRSSSMTKGKKVVIVMPAYNAERTIEQTWREVIEQDVVDILS